MPIPTTSRLLTRALPVLALAAACESTITVTDVAVRLSITPAADTLVIGATGTLFRAVAVNLQGDTIAAAPRWSVSRPDLATVDSVTGALTGVASGQTRVIARAGSLTDTAQLTVLGPVTLGLRLDTILLAPGDTFTIPRTALGALGQPIAATFQGGDSAIATITPGGFVQATGVGRVAFTVSAESLSVPGIIDVAAVDDTLNGSVVAVLTGAIERRIRLPSRWFQYPTGAGGSVLNMAARDPSDTERLLAVVRDSLTAIGTRLVGAFPEIDPTTTVCNPPNGWMLYQDRRATLIEAASIPSSGTIQIQRMEPIPGGWRISATVDVALDRRPAGGVALYGRFVVPLLSLAACPG